jgi:hypothetical protein
MAKWIFKKKAQLYAVHKKLTSPVKTHRLKVKKIFYTSGNQMWTGVAIVISNKIDFKAKTVKRDKDAI